MRLVLTSLLGFLLVANGLFMLVDPAVWYAHVPAVPETGPLNAHFVRDIGCAYAVAGAALIGYAFEERLRAAALAGALFLTLHALVHVADAAAGRGHADHALVELVTVVAPAAVALWLVLASKKSKARSTQNVQVAD
jgi:hypothetical protein